MNKNKINDVLKQLEEAGAVVLDTKNNENLSIEKLKENNKLLKAIEESVDSEPQEFGAWVSWTKSF